MSSSSLLFSSSPQVAAQLLAQRPTRPTLEMCLGVTAIALGMVMAGTGDLDCLRTLRALRWRVDAEASGALLHHPLHLLHGATAASSS